MQFVYFFFYYLASPLSIITAIIIKVHAVQSTLGHRMCYQLYFAVSFSFSVSLGGTVDPHETGLYLADCTRENPPLFL